VRPLSAILIVAAFGLWLPGCSLFKKSTGGAGDNPPNQLPPPKFPTADTKTDPLNQSRGSNGPGGLLAGRVRDGDQRPPLGTSILVVNADAKDDSSGQDVSVSPEGFFFIEKLTPGGKYKLIARGKQGDRAVAGIAYATASNGNLQIQVKEDFVTSTTPAVQGPYGSLKEDQKFEPLVPESKQAKDPTKAPSGWQPTGGVVDASNELSLPPMQIAGRDDDFVRKGNIVLPPGLAINAINVGPPKASMPEGKLAPIKIPPRSLEAPVPLGPTKIPSFVVVGEQVVSFALNDINLKPWEFRAGADRNTKLVLLDFWETACVPCIESIPALKELKNRYGSQGLEIVGIACEQGGTTEFQADRVNEVRQKQLINYRLLLDGDNGIAQTNLKVDRFPTLILLDDQGRILWRRVGKLGGLRRDELENLIRAELKGVKTY
jgi:thiol-disulfide isomerase/thioredoxin